MGGKLYHLCRHGLLRRNRNYSPQLNLFSKDRSRTGTTAVGKGMFNSIVITPCLATLNAVSLWSLQQNAKDTTPLD